MTEDSRSVRLHLQNSLGGRFLIERELGGGGMSRVFVAEETALGRRVVIKVLASELVAGLSTDRFTREVRVAARMQHPNILPVFAAGDAAGIPYYTMPFVEGESLRARLDRGDRIPVPEAIGILRDVARALAYAHERGVVHRDIKPENVLISRDVAVVADFGIAKAVDAARTASGDAVLTQSGMSIGTPAYMAPEQAAGDAVDHRADLYAWGVVSYELLAGHHPFAGKRSAQAFIAAHITESPKPLSAARPDLAPSVAQLVTRCLAKSPDDRPATAREVVDLLSVTSGAGQPVDSTRVVPSIAVLPFVNLSADPANEYFSDGISEELLSVLAQDGSLRVAARSSSFAFKGAQADLRTIADQLQVTTIVEGSVRRAGKRVRIAAQLVNAADGYHLWSGRFDRELTDIFAVQDEIATAIAKTLRERLLAGSAAGSAAVSATPPRRTRYPVSIDAYDEYLKGKHANNRRGLGHEEAPAHFERALLIDPHFAAAHAGLGETYLWLAIFFALPPSEAFARIRRHAQRALELEPDLADAHWLLGEVSLWHDWDADACERHIGRALALEPYHAGALLTTALCHNTRCRRRETLEASTAAVRVDPLGLGTRVWFLAMAYNVREYDLAIAEATRLIGEQPSYGEGYRWRAMAYMCTGNLVAARADLEKARSLGSLHVWSDVNLAVLACLECDAAEVRRIRDHLVQRSAREWIPPIALGQVEQALGDYESAIGCYERAYQMRDFLMTVFHTDPAFRIQPPGKDRPLTDDPRWIQLVRRVGLAPSDEAALGA